MIHVQPLTSILRFYEKGSFEERSPYAAIATLTYIDNDTVYISGLHGHVNKHFYDEVREHFRKLGIKEVHMERHGKHKTILV